MDKISKHNRDHVGHSISDSQHEYLSNISHSLKTPITCILGLVYQLKQGQLTSEQSKHIGNLEEVTNTLLFNINSLLEDLSHGRQSIKE